MSKLISGKDTLLVYCMVISTMDLHNDGFVMFEFNNLGEPTHTLVPCWMPKPLPLRNKCTGWFLQAEFSMV